MLEGAPADARVIDAMTRHDMAATTANAVDLGNTFLRSRPAALTGSPTAVLGLSPGLAAQVRFVRGIEYKMPG